MIEGGGSGQVSVHRNIARRGASGNRPSTDLGLTGTRASARCLTKSLSSSLWKHMPHPSIAFSSNNIALPSSKWGPCDGRDLSNDRAGLHGSYVYF